jgi:hypothetical protein
MTIYEVFWEARKIGEQLLASGTAVGANLGIVLVLIV